MYKQKVRKCIGIFSFFLLISQTCFAFRSQQSPQDLLEKASSVVVAEVISITPSSSHKSKYPQSEVVVSILQTLKGNHTTSLSFNILGSKRGKSFSTPSFMPKLKVGQTAVLLLRDLNKNNGFPFIGNSRGLIPRDNFKDHQEFNSFTQSIKTYLSSNSRNLSLMKKWPSGCSSCGKYSHRAKAHGQPKSYSVFGNIVELPLKIEARPSSDNLIEGIDIAMMDVWNQAGNFFDYTEGDGEWAWGNGEFEIAGVVTNEKLEENFDVTWDSDEMYGTIAFVMPEQNEDGEIIEADLVVSPQYEYTTDANESVDNPNKININFVMMHELGHVLGMDHDFTTLSVMNYMQPQYQIEYSLKGDDLAAMLETYPRSVYNNRKDAGVYLFYDPTEENFDIEDSILTPAVVEKGAPFTISKFMLDNAGTMNIDNLTINWFLADSVLSTNMKIPVGTSTHSINFASQKTVSATLTAPTNIAGGSYILHAEIELEGDANPLNNYAWCFLELGIVGDSSDPFAHAGSDQTVTYGETVTLDGKNSVNTNGVNFNWTQTKGESVELTINGSKASFTTPATEQTLEFQLELNGARDKVEVNVVERLFTNTATGGNGAFNKLGDSDFSSTPPAPDLSSVTGGGGCLLKRR